MPTGLLSNKSDLGPSAAARYEHPCHRMLCTFLFGRPLRLCLCTWGKSHFDEYCADCSVADDSDAMSTPGRFFPPIVKFFKGHLNSELCIRPLLPPTSTSKKHIYWSSKRAEPLNERYLNIRQITHQMGKLVRSRLSQIAPSPQFPHNRKFGASLHH